MRPCPAITCSSSSPTRCEPKSRRVLRSIYGNGPYVEGWALYTQQMMSDEGFMNNSQELRLTMMKQLLRSIANAILDIRLQTMGMTEQQALDLMMNDTFQEKEEATGKFQRAQLSSCQLPMYFIGWRGWLDTREEYKKRKGSAFQLQQFHDAALKESAVPLPALGALLQYYSTEATVSHGSHRSAWRERCSAHGRRVHH